MESSKYKRNINIDLIKILACIAVVGLHTLQRDVSYLNSSLYYLCGFAVPFFFMSSGYMLSSRNISIAYSVRKCFALLKLIVYWGIVVYGAYYLCLIVRGNGMDEISIIKIVWNLIKGGVKKGYLWQFWYIGALMIVYMCLPLISKIIHKNGAISERRLHILWCIFFLNSIVFQFASYYSLVPLQRSINQTFRIWTWFQYFLLGGCISMHIDKIKKINQGTVWLLSVLIVVIQNIIGRGVLHDTHAEYFYDSPLMILWIAVLFCYILKAELSTKMYEIIPKISSYTLGVYIIHPLIMYFVAHFVSDFSAIGGIIYWAVMTIFCFGVIHITSSNKIVKKLITLK